MGQCVVCHSRSNVISQALGLCVACALEDSPAAKAQAAQAHARSRRQFGLPERPPRDSPGVRCGNCLNVCNAGKGRMGYCGVRQSDGEKMTGGDTESAAVEWYYDALPTNCVADWVCPASGPAGYGPFTDTLGPERGYYNLAVFYEACSFDCLFCQNWHFKHRSAQGPRHSSAELACAVTERTRCICFFGGDPACQIEHALTAAKTARERCEGRILRICWETNGSMSRPAVAEMVQLSLESGGCLKFDLKAWDAPLHRALCGASNRATRDNFAYASEWIDRRRDPPLLVASTLLLPGYVEAEQVGKIARFIARLDPDIPYALLAFHPACEMREMPVTSRTQAMSCLAAAQEAGLTRVRLGNIHLLS